MSPASLPDMTDRRIEYMALEDLPPDPRNPKDHDHGAIDASVGRFGYIEPSVLDERTGLLIHGHGRRTALLAMQSRGDDPPDGITVDPGTGRWLTPVVRGWASKDDREASAALVGLNRTTEIGGWIDGSLLRLLDDLAASDPLAGLVGVGFDELDLEVLRQQLADSDLVDGWIHHGTATPIGNTDITIDTDNREVVVVIPKERYTDLYALLTTVEWIVDVRDRAKEQVGK